MNLAQLHLFSSRVTNIVNAPDANRRNAAAERVIDDLIKDGCRRECAGQMVWGLVHKLSDADIAKATILRWAEKGPPPDVRPEVRTAIAKVIELAKTEFPGLTPIILQASETHPGTFNRFTGSSSDVAGSFEVMLGDARFVEGVGYRLPNASSQKLVTWMWRSPESHPCKSSTATS